MGDSTSIGALVASILVIGSKAAKDGVIGRTEHVAYKAMRDRIAGWAGRSLAVGDDAPVSEDWRQLVAEAIDRQSAEEQASVLLLATALATALQNAWPAGIDREELNALALKLSDFVNPDRRGGDRSNSTSPTVGAPSWSAGGSPFPAPSSYHVNRHLGGGGDDMVAHEISSPKGTVERKDDPGGTEMLGPPAASTFTCHFLAELDAVIRTGRQSTLVVSIAREAFAAAADMASASSSADVEPDTMLLVEVFGRNNVRIVGERRCEARAPQPKHPIHVFFNVEPTGPGPAQIMVAIRQHAYPLAVLTLDVTAVEVASPDVGTVTVAASGRTTGTPVELNQLRIVSSQEGGTLRFHYEVSLPGIALLHFESPPIKGDQATYVARLYAEIEARYAETERDAADFRLELKSMGADLFEKLFPADMQTLLWTNKHRIGSIQVISTEPFVPWEFVFVKNPARRGLPRDGRFLAELGLTRWVHGSWHPSVVRVRPGRACYVAPEYEDPDDHLPQAAEEVAHLRQRLGAKPLRPTRPEVVAALEEGFDLLHFVCHGRAEQSDIAHAAVLLSERATGEAAWETGELTSRLVEHVARLQDEDGNQPMVVLNACQTARDGWQLTGLGGFARAFLTAGAGIYVGTLWSVLDAPARVFVQALYDALLAGQPLAEAAKIARSTSSAIEPSSWLAYAVYGDPSARLQYSPDGTPKAASSGAD